MVKETLGQVVELIGSARARNYAGPKSTIIVSGDAAIGRIELKWISISERPAAIALLGFNSAGQPWINVGNRSEWHQNRTERRNTWQAELRHGEQPKQNNPEPRHSTTNPRWGHVEDVLRLGSGPGTEHCEACSITTNRFSHLRNELLRTDSSADKDWLGSHCHIARTQLFVATR